MIKKSMLDKQYELERTLSDIKKETRIAYDMIKMKKFNNETDIDETNVIKEYDKLIYELNEITQSFLTKMTGFVVEDSPFEKTEEE